MNNMKNLLAVIDMQNDFVDGALGTPEAVAIVPAVEKLVREKLSDGWDVVFTRDTHFENYLDTSEGKKLPVKHCLKGTDGWQIVPSLLPFAQKVFDKNTFGSFELADYVSKNDFSSVLLAGVCTDICVISNAIIIKAKCPETKVSVKVNCCAGVSPASHLNAVSAMKMCQIDIE